MYGGGAVKSLVSTSGSEIISSLISMATREVGEVDVDGVDMLQTVN